MRIIPDFLTVNGQGEKFSIARGSLVVATTAAVVVAVVASVGFGFVAAIPPAIQIAIVVGIALGLAIAILFPGKNVPAPAIANNAQDQQENAEANNNPFGLPLEDALPAQSQPAAPQAQAQEEVPAQPAAPQVKPKSSRVVFGKYGRAYFENSSNLRSDKVARQKPQSSSPPLNPNSVLNRDPFSVLN